MSVESIIIVSQCVHSPIFDMTSSWQLQLKDSKSRLKHLFETKVLSDCSFVVGKENGQLVPGHRTIITAASPVLQKLLEDAQGDQPRVTLTDVEPEIFQLVLEYIYTDNVDVNDDTVWYLSAAAKTYQMPHLLKSCLDFVSNNLTKYNVLKTYDLVFHSSENEELKKKCEDFIKTNTKAVLSDCSFEEACLDVVVAVFSLEPLDIDSELDLLNAADRYAKHVSNADCDTDLVVRNILEKIRFLSLTPEEFAKGRASTTVLSASDACAILAKIAYDQSGVPMPSGFSLRRDPRKKVNVTLIEPLPEIKFKFRVPDIANLINKDKKAWSSKFKLLNVKWRIGVATRTDADSKKYLTIFAYSNCDADTSDAWSHTLHVELSLLRVDKGEPINFKFTKLFNKENPSWGYNTIVEASKLLAPNNDYTEDGAITIQVYINADVPQE